MMMQIRALLCLSALLAAAGAQAAEVGSGTLSLDQRLLEFSGGPIVGTNATNAASDDLQCIDPLLPCDTFALTVDLPEDVVEFFPSALVRISVDSTDSPTGADDYDLNLYNSEGELLGSSTSEGAAEAVSVLASGGVADFTVEVVHWLVVAGNYGAKMELDLGLPSADKTEAEVEQWLEDNSEGGNDDASSRTLASCAEPGVNILSDATGDNTLTGVPGQDLLELNVFQTTDDDGAPLIGFQLIVDNLSQLTPQTVYFSSFEAFGDVRGVRMAVDTQGAVTYETYVVGEDSDGERQGQFVDSARPAHPSSGHTGDGVITIYAEPNEVLLLEPGDTLRGFNAGIITFLGAEGVGASLNGDTMPEGLARQGVFEFLSAKDCAAPARSMPADGRSAATGIKGGALGGAGLGLLALLGLAGGRRRRR